MYEKPQVERFGSFRELTRVGISGTSDGWTRDSDGTSGCSGSEFGDTCRS